MKGMNKVEVKTLKEQDFSKVIQGEKVLIDCYADWCGPCKMLSPVIEEVAKKHDDFEFYKLDVDDAVATAQEYGIMSIPTILIFEKGELKKQNTGFIPAERLEELLK